jgi:TadE-like protein
MSTQPSGRGQSVVELAVFMPLVLFFGLICVQFGIIFMAYVNVMNVTRDAARWVSVHPHVVDSTTVTTVTGRLPAGMSQAALTLTFDPPCSSLSSGKCTGRDPGTEITATSAYVITSHLFLPATLGWGTWTIALPQSIPNYSIHMQVEPN